MSGPGFARRTVGLLVPHPIRRSREAIPDPGQITRRVVGEVDDRTGFAPSGKELIDKIFPDHWSFMLGELAMYSFVVLILTGIFLSLYFVPSGGDVVYHGSYRPLDGQHMTEALRSTLDISFGVRAGLLVRQTHHWAADIFIGAIVVHLMRIFFTSAYRKPREMNWCIGVTMLILALMNGYLGYSLPGDLLSGQGVRIGYGIMQSVPFVGSYLCFFIWGGAYPKEVVYLPRFFIAHVLIVPLLLIGLLGAHLLFVIHQKHTQWPGRHRTERNVVGHPMWPNFTAKSVGLMAMVSGLLVLLGAAFQIDPVWQFGPYAASHASDAAQPDWYQGWLEGALRLMPNWEISGLGHTFVVAVFVPGVLLPAVTFLGLYSIPFLERRLTGRRRGLELLVAPRRRPIHTAFGVAIFTFYFVLLFAGGDDVLAIFLNVSLPAMVWVLRILLFALPAVAAVTAWVLCRDLSRPKAVSPHPAERRLGISLATRPGVDPVQEAYFEIREEPVLNGHRELEPIPVPDMLVPDEVMEVIEEDDTVGVD